MRKLTFALLWLFVFSLPWEYASAIGLGSIGRAVGAAAAGAAVLTVVAEGRLRKAGPIAWLAAAFMLCSLLSLFWTISIEASSERVATFIQLIALLWLLSQFATSPAQHELLMAAYCLGAFIPLEGLFQNFIAGTRISGETVRYSATGFNADELGLMLALGIPMAWHLLMRRPGVVRCVAAAYCSLAVVAILLTGTRGAFLAAIPAVSIVPLTLPRRSMRSFLLAAIVVVAAAAATAMIVPEGSWQRMSTIEDEMTGNGTMTGRTTIWTAAWRVFEDSPLLGVGAGAFPVATNPWLSTRYAKSAHNVALAVLVEQGIVGFSILTCLLGACAWTIARLPAFERKLWIPLMLTWLVGSMSLATQYSKTTWLLFGLLAARQVSMEWLAAAGGSRRWRRADFAASRLPDITLASGDIPR